MTANNVTPNQYRLTLGCLGLSIIGGVLLITFGFIFLQNSSRSLGWPVVEGEVRSIRVTTNRSDSDILSYDYQVTYAYTINDIPYTSDRFSMGDGSTAGRGYDSEAEARSAAQEKYPVGGIIEIYYDVEVPDSAVLQPGPNSGTAVPLIMGILIFAGGIVMIFLVIKRFRAGKNKPDHI